MDDFRFAHENYMGYFEFREYDEYYKDDYIGDDTVEFDYAIEAYVPGCCYIKMRPSFKNEVTFSYNCMRSLENWFSKYVDNGVIDAGSDNIWVNSTLDTKLSFKAIGKHDGSLEFTGMRFTIMPQSILESDSADTGYVILNKDECKRFIEYLKDTNAKLIENKNKRVANYYNKYVAV